MVMVVSSRTRPRPASFAECPRGLVGTIPAGLRRFGDLPGRRQGRPWPYGDRSNSEGWGALPSILWRATDPTGKPRHCRRGSASQSRSTAYLRVAHIYMLISIPTDTSTTFGAFQAIWLSLFPDELAIRRMFASQILLPGPRFAIYQRLAASSVQPGAGSVLKQTVPARAHATL